MEWKSFKRVTRYISVQNEMRELMKTPDAMKDWFENKRREFDALPGD